MRGSVVVRFGSAQSIVLLAGALLSASCTSDKVVYRNSPPGTPPPVAAANFVGYTDTLTKQTVCGNCHNDKQAEWLQTHHANAWSDLQASGHAMASCSPCHTVDSYGNATKDTLVGFLATNDSRYHDVQCESCHGPGLVHVTAPSLENIPLASLAADTGGVVNGVACGECHTSANTPNVDEWVQSAHANTIPFSSIVGNASCDHCHVGQDVLQAWGVQTNYIEASQDVTNPLTVTCAVCHDPHGGPNAFQLRWPINVPDTAGMLCMKCHQRDAKPTAPADTHAPMSPEGPVLLGFAGWFPPSYSGPDTITDTHGTVAANPNLCVTCHMASKTVDNAGGALVDDYSGHLFIAAPCLDANGVPTTATCTVSQRDFSACASSGCHGAPSDAMSAMSTVITRLALLDSALSSQIVKLPSSLYLSTTMNTAIGARYNLWLAEKVGSEVHNPFLMEALLTSSIQQVQLDYGIPPTISVSLANILPATASRYK
jgi:predicted CXXCH cytochrome family protein